MKQERQLQILSTLSDDDLLVRLSELLQKSRRVESDLVAHIGEVDARRLYAREAAPSMFAYCTDILKLSEHEAYLRIGVARASRKYPVLLEMLAGGRLPLSVIARLAPHLTETNLATVLARAEGKSKREIEELVAELAPKPDVPTTVQKVPEPQLVPERVTFLHTPEPAPQAPRLVPRPVVQPLSPERYKIQFTASAELRDKLDRLRSLMRSSVPDGDLAAIIEEAVTEKLERLEAKRFAKTKSPRKSLKQADTSARSRYIPAPVKRAVRERDREQCAFVNAQGKRCQARDRLELHHKEPFARGGDRGVDNLQLMCRAHNDYMAEQDYGKEKMAYHRSGNKVSEPTPIYTVKPKGLLTFQVVHGYFDTRRAEYAPQSRYQVRSLRNPLAPRGRGDGGGVPCPGLEARA